MAGDPWDPDYTPPTPASSSAADPWDPGYTVGSNNPPPPGSIVNTPNRSYVVGAQPDPNQIPIQWDAQGQPQLYKSPTPPWVDTTGMSPEQKDLAQTALQMRRDRPFSPQPIIPFYQGGTGGWGDEAVSALLGAKEWLMGRGFTRPYNLAMEAQRQDLAQETAEHPAQTAASQLAGGAVASLPLTLAAPEFEGPLAMRAIKYGTSGGLLGGVQGFGSGDTLADRWQRAKVGGTIGAIGGATMPIVGDIVGTAVQDPLDRLRVKPTLDNLGLGSESGRALFRSGSADDAFGPTGQANIAAAGPQGMVADAGPAFRAQLDTAAQSSPGALRIAGQAISQRGQAAADDLNTALDATLGPAQGVSTATGAIRQAGAAARKTAYDAAYAAPIDYSSPAGQAIQSSLTQVPSPVFAKANTLLQLEGGPRIPLSSGPGGSLTPSQPLNVQQLDYVTRALRHFSEAGEDVGALGQATDFSNAYQRLSGQIRDNMRTAVPQYGTAVDMAANDIGRVQATNFGSTMLKPNVLRDDAQTTINGMSQPELDATKQGIRSYIDDLMARVRGAPSDPSGQDAREAFAALRDLNSRQAQEKLGMVLSPADAAALNTQIGYSTKAAQLVASQAANSATFGRAAQATANQALSEPGFWASLAERFPNPLPSFNYVWGRRPADVLARQDQMNEETARFLTQSRGQDALDALQSLAGAHSNLQQNQAIARNVQRVVQPLTGVGVFNMLPGLYGIPRSQY